MTYYRRPYRANYGTGTGYARGDGYISEAQTGLVQKIVNEIRTAAAALGAEAVTEADGLLAGITALQGALDGARTLTTREASGLIDALKGIQSVVCGAAQGVRYPGLPSGASTMVTRFPGKCSRCTGPVVAGVDLYVTVGTHRSPWCLSCATTDPAARAAQAAAERAEREAAERAVTDEYTALWAEIMVALGLGEKGRKGADNHSSGFAIPNETGTNDLDFFRLRKGKVFRIVGGHRDYFVAREQALPILRRIVAAGPWIAAESFGRTLGFCGHCGRHLTDEASRAAGLGPVCRTRR